MSDFLHIVAQDVIEVTESGSVVSLTGDHASL